MRVLNSYTETVMSPVSILLIVLFLIIAGLVYLLKDDIARFVKWHFKGFFYRNADNVWLVLCSIFVVLVFVCIPSGLNTHTYVEATIIDEYPIGALYSKYDIVNKRGDLWILELRDSYEETEEEVSDSGNH